jgi:cation:H+ antiporter
MRGGVLGRAEGLLLVLLYGAGVAWLWRRERQPPPIGEAGELAKGDEAESRSTGRALLLVLLGLLGMVVGGALAVRGAAGLVDVLGLSESVVGVTVLALATSAEMVALVWAAHRRGLTGLVVASAVGAVAYNATVSLGLAALVSPPALGPRSPVLLVAVATAVLPLVLLLGRGAGHLPRALGGVLVVGYLATAGWLFTV